MRRLLVVFALGLLVSTEAAGQAVPDGSQAARVPAAYRRTPSLRIDPFRHVMIPHWGLVFSGGAIAVNNTLNLSDIGALILLSDSSGLLASDVLNTIGLIPAGSDAAGETQAEGGVYLGGPFGKHLSFGISAQGRAYGDFAVDREVVSLLRGGNATQQEFSIGKTGGAGLGTAELGGHAVVRLGPIGSEDGVELSVGFGGRYIRPLVYGRERSTLESSRVIVSGDTIDAQVGIEAAYTPDFDTNRGSGYAADFLLRLDWPTSGFAVEALVANIGRVTIRGIERHTLDFSVATTDIQELADSLDTVEFVLRDSISVELTLPRIVRLSASAWANSVLQLDASATVPAGGDFELPLAVDLGSTWRFVRVLPLRVGVVLGGRHSMGVTGGFGIETRNFHLQAMAGTFGGFFEDAQGLVGRFEFGVFF